MKQGATPAKLYLDNIKVTVEAAPAGTENISESNTGAFRFNLPDPVRVFESVPEFSVEAEVGKGLLRVVGTDAFDRQVFTAEGKPGVPKLAVTLPGPDYYRIRAEVVDGGKAVKSAETSLLVTTPLPVPNGTGNFFLPFFRSRTPPPSRRLLKKSPRASRSKSSAA